MNIAICDDNKAEAVQIHAYVSDHFEKNCFTGNIHIFESGEMLLEAFSPNAFDVVFLDIYMSGMTGVEAARIIRDKDPHCALIFITSSPNHMPEGFSLRAASYVVKPITPEQMDTALLQCRNIFMKNARYIEVFSDRQAFKLPLIKISYVELEGRTALFHTSSGIIKTHMTLDEIEQKLGGKPFLRCHRAFLVNMNDVADTLEYDFLMQNGAKVPLRKNGRKEIKSAMSKYFTQRLFEEE